MPTPRTPRRPGRPRPPAAAGSGERTARTPSRAKPRTGKPRSAPGAEHRKPRVTGGRPDTTFARKPRPSTTRPPARNERPVERERPRAAAPAKPVQRETGPLTNSQKRYLRGLAHDLKPVIMVGQKGVTPSLMAELDAALSFHELIKVKLADDDRESRGASIELIRTSTSAETVQTIGKVACFYRRNPERAQFSLPR
jgi:RNA-binding protein